MKNAVRLLAFLCFCFVLPLTLSAQSPVGNWKLTVPTEDGGTMNIKVSIKTDGTYTVDFGMDGSVDITGEYKVNGNKMTIKDVSGPDACVQEAVYSFEVSDAGLKMTRISDPCEGRGGPEGVMMFSKA